MDLFLPKRELLPPASIIPVSVGKFSSSGDFELLDAILTAFCETIILISVSKFSS